MAVNPTTIAGWDTYPASVQVRPMSIGGGIRRALDGTAYRKSVAEKLRLVLRFDAISAEEYGTIRAIWTAGRLGSVAITNTDFNVSGTFIAADTELAFDPLDGAQAVWSGSLTFEER